jgi:hypothetical protein
MAGVAASILLAVSKGNTQASAQRPRLLISNTDPFTGLALSPRVCDTAETESSRTIHAWGHQQKLAVLVQFVGLREVPD